MRPLAHAGLMRTVMTDVINIRVCLILENSISNDSGPFYQDFQEINHTLIEGGIIFIINGSAGLSMDQTQAN